MKKVLCLVVTAALLCVSGAALAMEVNDVMARNGMVSSAHELASRAGVEILKKGGNAVDAACATMLALNVVEPNASGIGGGGFMVIRFARTGEVVELDYREVAPASSTKDMYASDKAKEEKWSQLGGKAVGVPGQLMGIWTALEKYGTMSFAEVAEPALRLAEEGFEVHPMQTQIITDNFEKMARYSPENVYFKDGLPVQQGEILKSPGIAKAFRMIGEQGPKAFYDGPIGQAVVAAVNKSGGNMSMEDLRNYEVLLREPVHGTYRGYGIYS
ncbi:MAG TPA: gamma-glutamyltransferase, partial [Synergistales bacterium]|nr:gamma-glutamyltransferase [Synergistales bacterium]